MYATTVAIIWTINKCRKLWKSFRELAQVNILSTLPQCMFLVKLLYIHQFNALASLRKFRIHHKLCKGLLLVNVLKKIILRFKKTGSLIVQLGSGSKTVSDIATAIVNSSQRAIAGSSSTQGVAWQLDLNISVLWKVLQQIPLLSIQNQLLVKPPTQRCGQMALV